MRESIIKRVLPSSLNREKQECFVSVAAIAKEVVWKTIGKGIVRGIISSFGLINVFLFHLKKKIRLEERSLSHKIHEIN